MILFLSIVIALGLLAIYVSNSAIELTAAFPATGTPKPVLVRRNAIESIRETDAYTIVVTSGGELQVRETAAEIRSKL